MSRAPVVAIVIGREPDHRYSMFRGYADAVAAVGGVPVMLVAAPDAVDHVLDFIATTDALLLTGGGDVSPQRYGTEPLDEVAGIDAERDELELAAYAVVRERGHKVLGICRGIQLLAVAAGGSLHQHLPAVGYDGHWDAEREFEPSHPIVFDVGTLAARAAAGATKLNSIHHQGVRDPGSLRATGWAEDGLIEAIESEGVLGIQWHPERLLDFDPRHLEPFRWLVEA